MIVLAQECIFGQMYGVKQHMLRPCGALQHDIKLSRFLPGTFRAAAFGRAGPAGC